MNLPRPKTQAVDEMAEVFTIDEWKTAVEAGAFVPEDGKGFLCLDAKTEVDGSNVWVKVLPPWATHVSWYNK